jgi:ABC-type polar amino acid transport system ATPase subunit
VFNILRELADQGQTVVVVTHDAGLARRCDRRINIVDGKIAETTYRDKSADTAPVAPAPAATTEAAATVTPESGAPKLSAGE